jgi:hypothetical protein
MQTIIKSETTNTKPSTNTLKLISKDVLEKIVKKQSIFAAAATSFTQNEGYPYHAIN